MSQLFRVLLLILVVSMTRVNSDIVPDFSGTDIHGHQFSLYELLDEGKHVWVHFTGKF